MIKVVSTSLILIALFGTAPRNWSQNDAAAVAERVASEEAVRRDALKIQLRTILSEAQALQAQDDLGSASRAYEEAWDKVQSLGVTVDRERAETIRGMTEVRMELARRAQSRGDLEEASKQVERILRIDPKNTAVQSFKVENDKRIQERIGKEPSKGILERIPEVQKERNNTSILVQDARVLMEMGKLDEAEAKLKQATREDPEHRAAFYYLTLITERRYQQESRRREVGVKEKIVEVERTWNDPVGRETLPIANPYASTNRIYTSAGRQAIMRKLNGIILERYEVPGDLELSEVIKDLARIARDRDVDKQGVNFIIAPFLDKPGPQAAAPGFGFAGATDPLTGAPLAATTAETPVRVEDYKITIDPPLVNVRLLDVLDAIIKVAKPPEGGDQNIGIKYSLEDYAIVFSRRAVEADPLYTRSFKVDPNTFIQGLDGVFLQQNQFNLIQTGGGGQGGVGGGAGGGLGGGVTSGQTAGGGAGPGAYFQFSGGGGGGAGGIGGGGGGGAGGQTGGGGIIGVTITNSMSSIQDAVRNFFVAAGVDFQTNQQAFGGGGGAAFGQPLPPQKSIFFNDRNGVLLVRATLKDLDIIESAIQILNLTPPQVTIETRIAEVTQRDNKAVGFDWYLGNILLGNGKAGLQGGTAPSFNDGSTFANPEGVFPNPAIPRANTDQLLTSGLRSNAAVPAVATISGILTDPQFRVVVRALEQREGVDLLSAPKVTTLSGRQARISIEDTQTIITGFSVGGLNGGGVGAVGGVGGVGGGVPAGGAVGGGF